MADFGCHRIEILLDLLGSVAEPHGFPTRVRCTRRDLRVRAETHIAAGLSTEDSNSF